MDYDIQPLRIWPTLEQQQCKLKKKEKKKEGKRKKEHPQKPHARNKITNAEVRQEK